MSEIDVKNYPWNWYWRTDGTELHLSDCGITCEPHPGHGYSIVRCPRYISKEQWEEIASHICELHNASLK